LVEELANLFFGRFHRANLPAVTSRYDLHGTTSTGSITIRRISIVHYTTLESFIALRVKRQDRACNVLPNDYLQASWCDLLGPDFPQTRYNDAQAERPRLESLTLLTIVAMPVIHGRHSGLDMVQDL
jgi:hypothetical protein